MYLFIFRHLLSRLGAGLFAICVGFPVDVIKTKMMGNSQAYKSMLDFIKTLQPL